MKYNFPAPSVFCSELYINPPDNTLIDNSCSLIELTPVRTQCESKETIHMCDINVKFVNSVVTNEK